MNSTEITQYVRKQFSVSPQLILVYMLLYFGWGLAMNAFGQWAEIARFTYWWQIITCYLFYMVPVSLLLRGLPWHTQYAYGFVAMGILEFLGYALETSFAYPQNLMDQYFGVRNFSLAMALFFGLYFPLGNWAVSKITRKVFGEKSIS